jgi:ubiquinone/menaquinone biosynthesis C-methylase UbiE
VGSEDDLALGTRAKIPARRQNTRMDEVDITRGPAVSRLRQVKQMFEEPEWYVRGTGFNIRIRQETVCEMTAGSRFDRILDIGCGTGAISIPLLRPDNRLTLVDLSSAMISIARSNVPTELAENVEFLNKDLTVAPLALHAYDLILCLGVLAHVESPAATVTRIASLLRPGGMLILEFSDSSHPIGLLNIIYHKLRGGLSHSDYSLNRLSRRDVTDMIKTNHLRLVSAYRYGMWLPLLHKFFSQSTLYSIVRALSGTSRKGRNAFLGNEYIYLIKG